MSRCGMSPRRFLCLFHAGVTLNDLGVDLNLLAATLGQQQSGEIPYPPGLPMTFEIVLLTFGFLLGQEFLGEILEFALC